MLLSINELEKDIKYRFNKEKDSVYFGIGKTEYIYKFDRLILQIGHYKDHSKSYRLIFNGVESCRITQESYTHKFDEEIFEGFGFFWQIKNSRFKEDFNSWSTYEGFYSLEKYNNLKSYRIIGQNNFVDILTTEEPIIELIEAESK